MAVSKRLAAVLFALLTAVVTVLAGAPAASAQPYENEPEIECTPFRPLENTEITCEGDGYLPFDHVEVTLHTATYVLGFADADANGHWGPKEFDLPREVDGPHTVTGTGVGGYPNDSASTHIIIRDEAQTNGGGTKTVGGGTTAVTGVEIAGIGLLGVGLLVGGIVLVVGGKRRRRGVGTPA